MPRELGKVLIRGELGERPKRLDPRMVFSPDLSVLYVSAPKTGCTTIKAVVAAGLGLIDPELLSRGGLDRIHRVVHDSGEIWSNLADEEREEILFGDNTFRFTSIRNPYERLVSCYLNKIADVRANYYLAQRLRLNGEVSVLSFLRFVDEQPPMERDVHCRALVDLCHWGKVNYTDVVRYESFEDDLRRIMQKLNMADLRIPRPKRDNHTDAGAHVHELLGVDECALIRKIYQRDFDEFGYSLDLASVGKT